MGETWNLPLTPPNRQRVGELSSIQADYFISRVLGGSAGYADLKLDINNEDLEVFDFVTAKSNIDTKLSRKAKNLGFFLADVTITLRQTEKIQPLQILGTQDVVIASDSHNLAVQNIAYKSFIYDRFHNDPLFSDSNACEIKRRWIENYFRGKRGHQCFVSLKNSLVTGFLLTVSNPTAIKIDLLAVDSNFRGQSVGRSLILRMIDYYKNEEKAFEVQTQLNNTPSIKLYQSLGFTPIEHGLVWHYHSNCC